MPSDVEYKILLEKAKQNLAPAPSCIVEHYKFNIQQPGVSVASFIAQLRVLAMHCEFGEMPEDMPCDRIVCGLSDT